MIAEEARVQEIKYIKTNKDNSFLDKLPADLKQDLLNDPKAMEMYMRKNNIV